MSPTTQPVFPLAIRPRSSVYTLLLEVEGLSPAWVLTGFGDPIGHEQSYTLQEWDP